VLVGTQLLIFGGRTASSNEGRLCQIGCLDTETKHWSVLSPAPPGRRSGHTSTLIGNNIYVIGGNHGLTEKDNVYVVRLSTIYVPIKKSKIDPRERVQNDLEEMWINRDFCDFNLVVENNISVPVHKFMLATRCPYFRSMFRSGMLESTNNQHSLFLYDVTIDHLLPVLQYIYTGKLFLQNRTAATFLNGCSGPVLNEESFNLFKGVLVLASRFMLDELVIMCENGLMSYINYETVVHLLDFACFYSASNLKWNCLNWILNYSNHNDLNSMLTDLNDELLKELAVAKSCRFLKK